MSEIAEKTRGRWRDILPTFGVDTKYLTGKHAPCPMCGGRDRFRFDNKDDRGTFICTHCGAGDGFRLVELITGRAFKDIARDVERAAGISDYVATPSGPSPDETLTRMRRMWQDSEPAPGISWWRERLISPPDTDDVHWSRSMRAVLSLVRDPEGRVVNLHRTYMNPKRRLLMPLPLPPGCAVRASAYETGPIGVAEGIETARAAFDLTGIPTWACMTADNLSKWIPPVTASHITIFADNDASFTGMWAAGTLGKRLVAQKRSVDVRFPAEIGDWNDVVIRGQTV